MKIGVLVKIKQVAVDLQGAAASDSEEGKVLQVPFKRVPCHCIKRALLVMPGERHQPGSQEPMTSSSTADLLGPTSTVSAVAGFCLE